MKILSREKLEFLGGCLFALFLAIIAPAIFWSANDDGLDFWEATGMVALCWIGFFLVLATYACGANLSDWLLKSNNSKLVFIGGSIKIMGYVIIGYVLIWIAFNSGGSYNPDCPTGAERYC